MRAGVAAWRAGADRLEVCARIATGGLTPRPGTVARLAGAVPIPLHVMIRPRTGNFVYDDDELAAMVHTIRGMRAAGVVCGMLTRDRRIHREAVAALRDAARPMAVTFHRAFDNVADPLAALDDLIALGVDYVLTSGGARTARAGAARLRELVRRAGDRIGIIAAGTIRHHNVRALLAATGVAAVHAHVDAAGCRRLAAVLREDQAQ